MNSEHKFQQLKQQLDRVDLTATQSRIEAQLRLAWAQPHSIPTPMQSTPTNSKRWRWLQLGIGLPTLAGLALVTTLAIQPAATTNMVEQPTKDLLDQFDLQADYAKPSVDRGLTLGQLDASGIGGSANGEYGYDDVTIEYEPQEYTYQDGDAERQLFSESVGLSVDLKGNVLDTIHNLRNIVSTLNGQLVNISYYDINGTVDLKIPADQLNALEDELKQLDANHQIEVDSYNVVNVSEEVVTIDERIQEAEDAITQAQTALTAAGLSDAERQALADVIKAQESEIAAQQTTREETIAKYNLIAVRITLLEQPSIFDGNYQAFDRSTISGQIKYELSKAIYVLIRSTGKVTRFLVWLAVYSVILVPVYFLFRAIIRKIVRLVKSINQK